MSEIIDSAGDFMIINTSTVFQVNGAVPPTTHYEFKDVAIAVSSAVILCVLVALIVPWIDFAAERLHVNPISALIKYFAWCERKQEEMRQKS